ncbi:MAG: phage antirepressor protein, partial [Bilophila wadsworthia]
GRDYKAVKGIPWFLDVFADTPAAYSVAGRKLSDMSRRMDYEIREIEDSRFGSVKAYHVDVIEAFRLALKNDLNMLGKYRLRRAA